MLLKEIDEPFDSNDFIYEVKFDGLRACIFVGPNTFKIMNRHKKDITYLYPELQSIQKLVHENTILDGEIISIQNNRPSFSKLQERSHLKDKKKINIQSNLNPVLFVAFDILYQGKDLTTLKILERKKRLNEIQENDILIISKTFKKQGIKLFQNIKKKNLEGIVAKRIDSTYHINTRSNDWIKIKNNKEEKFLIGGYEEKKNGIISLLLGEFVENNFYYVGSVILSKKTELFYKVSHCRKKEKTPFVDYERKNVVYLVPKLECMIQYMERTKTNHLRQPYIKNK